VVEQHYHPQINGGDREFEQYQRREFGQNYCRRSARQVDGADRSSFHVGQDVSSQPGTQPQDLQLQCFFWFIACPHSQDSEGGTELDRFCAMGGRELYDSSVSAGEKVAWKARTKVTS